jgi:hypothetical protein
MSAEGATQTMNDDITGYKRAGPSGLKLDEDNRDHALTGVAIEYRPSGPGLRETTF